MALIELNMGHGQGDEEGGDAADARLDEDEASSSTGRRLLGGAVVVAVVAGVGYAAYRRRRAARDDSDFAKIEFDDEAAEAVESSEE
ncbi:DLW-39 family protein [Halogeometricum sp. S1BR25-6]|uniref:DLW-39 family protein n=1 Tax=Halogeometricum salsisoli TaxID=2950536 RepID=A0ABU2GGN9_9EURY|nr:DLW-39 family protein [Halogeometricum sp. S1BR25-6]MDS0299955.1 DLW-39 family protein [Halogeometricum sp. S1BR25-6]